MNIPVVNYDSQKTIFENLLLQQEQVKNGLETSGFIVLRGVNWISESVNAVYDCAKSIFSVPELTKRRLSLDSKLGQRGYLSFFAERSKTDSLRILESFQIGNENVGQDENLPLPKNLWPDGFSEQRSVLQSMFYRSFNIANAVLKFTEVVLDCPQNYFANMLTSHASFLRLTQYAPVSGTNVVRCPPHKDLSLVTVMCHPTDSGLEIFCEKTKKWLPVSTETEDIVINVGSILEYLTENQWQSSTHRVISNQPETGVRYSLPLFVIPHPAITLSKTSEQPDTTFIAGAFYATELERIREFSR